MTQKTEHTYTGLIEFLAQIQEPLDNIWLGFWDYRLVHPEVEDKLAALALRAKGSGLKKYGISPLWEVLRWHISVERGAVEEFKCANAYRSRYARWIMHTNDDLAGFFNLSELRAGGKAAA